MTYKPLSVFVQSRLREICPAPQSSRVYARIYSLVRSYNEVKEVHKKTGVLYSTRENEQLQTQRIKGLVKMVEVAHLAEQITFRLEKKTIVMKVNGQIYRGRV